MRSRCANSSRSTQLCACADMRAPCRADDRKPVAAVAAAVLVCPIRCHTNRHTLRSCCMRHPSSHLGKFVPSAGDRTLLLPPPSLLSLPAHDLSLVLVPPQATPTPSTAPLRLSPPRILRASGWSRGPMTAASTSGTSTKRRCTAGVYRCVPWASVRLLQWMGQTADADAHAANAGALGSCPISCRRPWGRPLWYGLLLAPSKHSAGERKPEGEQAPSERSERTADIPDSYCNHRK